MKIPVPAFRPSPTQARFLAAASAAAAHSVAGFCRSAQINPSTYYRWCRNAGFRAWFLHALTENFIAGNWGLVAAAHAAARGDFNYWQAAFDLTFQPGGHALLRNAPAAPPDVRLGPAASPRRRRSPALAALFRFCRATRRPPHPGCNAPGVTR